MPQINTDYEGAFPNANNNYNGEQSISSLQYDQRFDLFRSPRDRFEQSGPFSPGNPGVKKQYYRYNLMQNKIQAIGNDEQSQRINKATSRYFGRRNHSIATTKMAYQMPSDVILSARELNQKGNTKLSTLKALGSSPDFTSGLSISPSKMKKATSFLPAVSGQNQYLTSKDADIGIKDAYVDDQADMLFSNQQGSHIDKLRDIIKNCQQETNVGQEEGIGGISQRQQSPFKYIDHALKEIQMKRNDMDLVLQIMRDLETNETMTFEQMFRYKMNEKDEENRESRKVTKEFFMDALDGSKKVNTGSSLQKKNQNQKKKGGQNN